MTQIGKAAGRLDIAPVPVGDDLTITCTVTENAVNYVWTGATVTKGIYQNGVLSATNWTVTASVNGTLILALTDANTTALGAGTFQYFVSVTKSGVTDTWLSGNLTLTASHQSGGTTTGTATLSIVTAPTTTIEVTGSIPSTAAALLTLIKTVDGAGSGLDADLLDGESSAYYAPATGLSDHIANTTDAHDAAARFPARVAGYTTAIASEHADIYLSDHDVKFDVKGLDSANMTAASAVLSSSWHTFTSADVGKKIKVWGAGVAGAHLKTTIASVSGGNATLTTAASTTVVNAWCLFGTDDTAAIQACFDLYVPRMTLMSAGTHRFVMPRGWGFITQLVHPRACVVEGAGFHSFGPLYGIYDGIERSQSSLLYQLWDTNSDAILWTSAAELELWVTMVTSRDWGVVSDPENTVGNGICFKDTFGNNLPIVDGFRMSNVSADGFPGDGFHLPAGCLPGHFIDCRAFCNTGAGFYLKNRPGSNVLDLDGFSGDQNGDGLVYLQGQGGGATNGVFKIRSLKSEARANMYRTGDRQEYAIVLDQMGHADGAAHVDIDGCEHIANGDEAAAPEGVIKIINTAPNLTWRAMYTRIASGQTSGATLYAGQATTPVLINDTNASRTVTASAPEGSYVPGGSNGGRVVHSTASAPLRHVIGAGDYTAVGLGEDPGFQLNGALPILSFYNSAAAADLKHTSLVQLTTGELAMRAYTDAGAATDVFTVGRTQVSQLGRKLARRATAVNVTIALTDEIIGVTDTSSPRTITLPSAATAGAGATYTIKDESGAAGTNNITVARSGSDTIDGATTAAVSTNYGTVAVYSDGTSKWLTR